MKVDDKNKNSKEIPRRGFFYGRILSIIILVAGLFSASYVATGTLDFDGKFKQFSALIRKLLPQNELILTTEQLAEFDGSDPSKPIYLAINGRVYDVSAGPSYYGKDGSYSFFAGKDAARAYITGCFETDLIPDLRGLSKEELKGLDTWIDFYEKSTKYFYVGKVIHDPIPEDAPLPKKSGIIMRPTEKGFQKMYRLINIKKRLYGNISVAPLFDKILVANRGEIACRVMRTAKKLGIKTVAVYSEADSNSMHVQMAEESYCIGPAPSSASYLNASKIIDIAKRSKAQAIHPGYGFLSENSDFAEQVTKSGLTFIGPPAQSIIDMGSKSASKNIMIKAGVPVVPGYHGSNQDPSFLKAEADKMGYPVLIKAVKGGGGKGMRIVYSENEFLEMLQSSRREAMKHFSDDNVLIEKYIVRPRHVEVQIFADKLGNAVYLFERDCSVQRRHQKILEEAPGPDISEELRMSLGEKAVAAAKAVSYVGAGTVEFILDVDTNNFYFMEMNTRLQVEHPITEMITGTDLVEWQFQVASGNRLPKLQSELELNGHAFEARIYAENPERGFLPDTGKLIHIRSPDPASNVRIETGVRQGDEVSVHYDPMISKLVVWDINRTEALRVLRKALGEYEVVGPKTNIEFLKSLASHHAFISGEVDTGFIKRHEKSLFKEKSIPSIKAIVQASLFIIQKETRTEDIWNSRFPFRLNSNMSRNIQFYTDKDKEKSVDVEVTFNHKVQSFSFLIKQHDGSAYTVDQSFLDQSFDEAEIIATIDNVRSSARVVIDKGIVHVFSDGVKHELILPIPSYAVKQNDASSADSIITPMPCKISQINVKVGDNVTKGQTLIILEAMKMEHSMKSPIDGTVSEVLYDVGDLVSEGKCILRFGGNT